MDQITLKQTLSELTAAYIALEEAKTDCKTVVDATLETYLEHHPDATKDDCKAIVKLAKASAKMNQDGAKEEAQKMVEICESAGV